MQAMQIEGKDGRLQPWTVKDLREALAELPDDNLVICSSDAEGNQFHPLMQVGIGEHYRTDGRFGDLVYGEKPKPADRPCVVLTPMD